MPFIAAKNEFANDTKDRAVLRTSLVNKLLPRIRADTEDVYC